MKNHDGIVRAICAQVRARAEARQPVRLAKAGVSHFVPDPHAKRAMPRIDCSGLVNILQIDPAARTCTAESGVAFADLVRETLKHGLIPMCVPELKGITVGGAISGCSIESMSYRYGGFHDSCTKYEVVTGAGEAVACSPERNPDLFHMIHGSYGTLGILTRATFRLIPARPFVRMRYLTFRTFREFEAELKARCNRADVDFIDGIVHARDRFVLCLGDMVDAAPHISRYDWLRIFYKSTRERDEDYLTLPDYLFRYDAECHWLTRTVPLMETLPVRFALGKVVLGSTNLIRWSKRLAPLMRLKRRPEVVVDVFIPAGRFGEFYSWYERDFDFYPLWIVPYRAPALYPWIAEDYARAIGDTLFIDCAVYGKKNSRPEIDYSEVLEKKTVELGGIKTLISRNHFDERTFWTIYNKPLYDRVKSSVDPHHLFLNLYEKFRPAPE